MVTTEKKNTVLYQVGHFGFLINCMLHKQYYHPDANAVFLIDKVILKHLTLQDFMQHQKNFSFLGEFYYYSDKDIINAISSGTNIEQVIENYFDNFLKNNGVVLEQISDIYSVFDTFNAFGVYLCLKKTEFNMIETTAYNFLTTFKRYNLNTNISPKYDEVITKYRALSAHCLYCKRLYSFDETVFDGKETIKNNSPVSLIKKLSNNDIQRIVKAYYIKYNSKKNYTLFILNSEWFAGLNKLKYPDNYFFPILKVVDLYLKDKQLLIKPHPNAEFPIEIWNKNIPDADILPAFFPSILIPYLSDIHISEVASTGSSGANGVNYNNLSIPFALLTDYQITNKLIFLIALADYLNIPREKYYHIGLNDNLINSLEHILSTHNLVSKLYPFLLDDHSYTIIDNKNLKPQSNKNKIFNLMRQASNDSIVFFISEENYNSLFCGYQDLLKYVYVLNLGKEKTGETAEDLSDENIYLFCKSEQRLNEIKQFKFIQNFNLQKYTLFSRNNIRPINDILSAVTVCDSKITLYNDAQIIKDLIVEEPGILRSGEYMVEEIGAHSLIGTSFRSVGVDSIGRYANVGDDVQIGTYNHPTNFLTVHNLFDPGCNYSNDISGYHNFENNFENIQKMNANRKIRNGNVTIGNDVFIGQGTIILSGVKVGDGAIIGAGSVVTKDIPPYAIAAGVPARVIRFRFRMDQIVELEKIKWWNYQPSILSNCNLSDIDATINTIKQRIADGYPLFEPFKYKISKNSKDFKLIIN